MQKRNATVAVIGAGDYIGAEIVKKFAAEGFTVFAGRRNGEKLAPLVKDVEDAGGAIVARSLDARKEDETTAFLKDADAHAPLEVCIFNVGANVNFPILETTDRVFRKVWEMACWAGFVAGREAARLMMPRGQGHIFFTGATASLRGGIGFARGGAIHGARARTEEHPCRASGHRFRRGHRLGARAALAALGQGGAGQSGPVDATGIGRRGLLAALPAAKKRLDFRNGNPPVRRKVVRGRLTESGWPTLT
jgi:NAD(P)-dependent dehydrogenase (short-subunit alcohol dehydrogenase family)